MELTFAEQRLQNEKVTVYFNTKIEQTDQTLTFEKATINGFPSSAISFKEEKWQLQQWLKESHYVEGASEYRCNCIQVTDTILQDMQTQSRCMILFSHFNFQ